MHITLSQKILIVMLVVIFIMAMLFIIPKQTKPGKNTRVVLEHTHETYIAPPCFQQSDATNFLGDEDLQEAKKLNYGPHDTCTEEALAPDKDRLFISILKDIGLLSKKWDGW